MYGVERSDRDARRAWAAMLKQYCRLDTLSMVLIFEFWRRVTGIAGVSGELPVLLLPDGTTNRPLQR